MCVCVGVGGGGEFKDFKICTTFNGHFQVILWQRKYQLLWYSCDPVSPTAERKVWA